MTYLQCSVHVDVNTPCLSILIDMHRLYSQSGMNHSGMMCVYLMLHRTHVFNNDTWFPYKSNKSKVPLKSHAMSHPTREGLDASVMKREQKINKIGGSAHLSPPAAPPYQSWYACRSDVIMPMAPTVDPLTLTYSRSDPGRARSSTLCVRSMRSDLRALQTKINAKKKEREKNMRENRTRDGDRRAPGGGLDGGVIAVLLDGLVQLRGVDA